MRTETEMHDLVVAKVAAHRRRRALLASAGGGVAAALLVVAVVAGASSGGLDDKVEAGPGDPSSTTEAPTTTEAPDPTSTSTTSSTSTTTTEPPPETSEPTPTTTEPPPTTTEPPVTTTDPPGAEPTVDVVPLAEGDMEVTFTVTTDPARPGRVRIRFQLSDPTGVDVHDDGYRVGPGGSVARLGPYANLADVGDTVASCGHGDLEGTEPGTLDEEIEVELPSGPQTLRLTAQTLPCHEEGTQVLVDRPVVVP